MAVNSWATDVDTITIKPNEKTLSKLASPKPALQWLVSILGSNQTATLLGVSKPQPSRWIRGEAISVQSTERILALNYLLRRLFTSSLHTDEVGPWLTSPQPFLNGARPIDVLVSRGIADVLRAVDTIDQGAYA